MPKNTLSDTIRTKAYILKRTNYGEADRILNILTPNGKITAIAKGVRREKSKLAGGIEMFSLIDINVHQGKNDFGIITSAKLVEYYSEIIKDLEKIELASEFIKRINQASEGTDNNEFFSILDQSLRALNQKQNLDLIKTWFLFNIKKASGEEINLYRDSNGKKLSSEKNYIWDPYEKSLVEKPNGDISADEIKLMRLISTNKLATIIRIKNIGELIPPIFSIAREF